MKEENYVYTRFGWFKCDNSKHNTLHPLWTTRSLKRDKENICIKNTCMYKHTKDNDGFINNLSAWKRFYVSPILRTISMYITHK